MNIIYYVCMPGMFAIGLFAHFTALVLLNATTCVPLACALVVVVRASLIKPPYSTPPPPAASPCTTPA